MDGNHCDATDELQRLQSNIASLFNSVLNERNKYKNEKEKKLASVEALLEEMTNLRRENEQLRKTNNDLRSSCENCSELKEKLIVQDRKSRKLEKTLDAIKNFLDEVSCKSMNPSQFFQLLMLQLNDLKVDSAEIGLPHNGNNKCNLSSPSVKGNSKIQAEEIEQFNNTSCGSNGPVDSYRRTDLIGVKDEKVGEWFSKSPAKCRSLPTEIKKEIDSEAIKICNESESTEFEARRDEFHTPKKVERTELDFIDSPFPRDLGIKNGEKSPILLVDQRLLLNRYPSTSSPPNLFKRKAIEASSTSPGRGGEKKLFLKSPRQRKYKSPAKGVRPKSTSHLRTSNSLEAEVSLAGVRKLKQTQLNLEYYKSKSKEDNNDDGENISDVNLQLCDENKMGEDDLIMESPKHSARYLEEFMKAYRRDSSETPSGEGSRSKSPPVPARDPEETFVSSFFMKENEKLEKEPGVQKEASPGKKQLSPEYNSVPYPYKGSPVRKKSERMKLPGQMCMECNKYYKAILGEIDPKKLQEILDRCSRHRDKHYNIVDTPPGYWKPYLTATMDSMSCGAVDETMIE